MSAFRAAAAEGDARLSDRAASVATTQSRRRGSDEAALRQDLFEDLNALFNTIDLGSAIPLAGLDHVSRSVLNFGLRDITAMSFDGSNGRAIADMIRAAILEHEPRILAGSLKVEPAESDGASDIRPSFRVWGEVDCNPLAIPIEFVAELDVGAGKIEINRP